MVPELIPVKPHTIFLTMNYVLHLLLTFAFNLYP